jgi:MinD superfamily P-loop ATPase
VRSKKITQLAVISGKGGTGKTSYVAAFAHIQTNLVLADCDVDAANLHLLVGGRQEEGATEPFKSGFKAAVDPDVCTGCGRCLNVCRFHAVVITEGPGPDFEAKARIRNLSCEGCGCCADECPTGAISLRENTAGELYVSPSRFGPLVHARLTPGEGTSGKLVTRVREKAKEIAFQNDAELVLIDGSPGIGCPVIASISGTDGALIVTEPTVSGLHDLIRVADLCAHFKIPTFAVINKCDINPDVRDRIKEQCRDRGIEVLGGIPFDPVFVSALTAGVTVMEYDHMDVTVNLKRIWSELLGSIRKYDHGVSKAAAK